MIFSRHCALCENEIKSLEKGVTCKLSQKRPNFKDTCPDIILDKKFQVKLEKTNLHLRSISKRMKREYFIFFLLFILGFALIIGNKFYAEIFHNGIYYWSHRAGAIGIGSTILIGAFLNLNRFRNKFRTAIFKRNKIDAVLKKYGISYQINIDHEKEIHGNQNIEITTEYKNWKEKRTTTKN